MKVDFPVDERSEKFLRELESDEDVTAINAILLSKRGDDFSNYASIICFCFKEKDLMDLNSVTTLPESVKIWAKRKMLENDDLFQTFFKHLFSLYSSYSQTEEGLSILGKKRSLFPEVYLYHRIKELYSYSENNIVRRDCYVVINDWNTRRDRSREEGQKIDIGAWDPDKEAGQCYECKVKFYIKEKVHQLKFLEDIRDHSLGKIHVFLASFAPKKVLLRQLMNFFPGRDLSKINIFGIEELKNL